MIMDSAADSIGRLRSRSTGSAIAPQAAPPVPPLALEGIREANKHLSASRMLQQPIAASFYTMEACKSDSRGSGSWEIISKSFTPVLIKEIAAALNPEKLHKDLVDEIDGSLATISDELKVFKQSTIPAKSALQFLDVRLKQLDSKIEQAIEQQKTELRLVCCEIKPEFIQALLSTALRILHIEQCPLSIDAYAALAFELPNRVNCLESLQFVGVHLDVQSFKAICDGIVSQNMNKKGISTLAFVACNIDEKYAKILKNLLSKSKHLERLNLEKNNLGSASSMRKIALRSSSSTQNTETPGPIRRSKSSIDGMRVQSNKNSNPPIAPLKSSAKAESSPTKGELSRRPSGSPCHAITSILKGVIRNQEARANLTLVILSENKLTSEDRDLLVSAPKGKENTHVQFNVAKNGLNALIDSRLIYGSPRDISSLSTTPRAGSRNSGKFAFIKQKSSTN
jgi:hypothetical protein